MPFIDEAEIFVKAGNGGKGCRSFYHDKLLRYPRPDGGDGGQGGDIIVIADKRLHTLRDFKFRQHFKSENGKHGGSNKKKGREGSDCLIPVPLSTVIKDVNKKTFLRELTVDGEKLIVAKGGDGGRGNAFKKKLIDNKVGEEKKIRFELRLIANIGIIGLPNAGKSTLVSRLTNAKPKIADYPFTTKDPILGTITYENSSLTVADLPGLIEGAHQGKGLGDKFLKHVEKTDVLIHLVDIASSDKNPVESFTSINRELKLYSRKLALKPQIVVVNKIDLLENKEPVKKFKKQLAQKVYAISALNSDGIKELLEIIKKTYEKSIFNKN